MIATAVDTVQQAPAPPAVAANPILAEKAAAIRELSRRTRENIIEIGRHLVEVRDQVDHGEWLDWIEAEFSWSDQTARNFIRVYELSRDPKFKTVLDLDLPLRVLYQVAAPKAEAARQEIAEQIETGEPLSQERVIQAVMGRRKSPAKSAPEDDDNVVGDVADVAGDNIPEASDGADGTADGAAEVPDSASVDVHADTGDGDGGADASGCTQVAAAVAPRADDGDGGDTAEAADGAGQGAVDEHDRGGEHAGNEADGHGEVDAGAGLPAEPAPDPATIAAAAVNKLSYAETQRFLDQLSSAHTRAFEQRFGARNSDHVEIGTLAGECIALLSHARQHVAEIHKKLAQIKRLAGGKSKNNKSHGKSNAHLDLGAYMRGMHLDGRVRLGARHPFQTADRRLSGRKRWLIF